MTGLKYFAGVLIQLHYQNALVHITEINQGDDFYLCEVVLKLSFSFLSHLLTTIEARLQLE